MTYLIIIVKIAFSLSTGQYTLQAWKHPVRTSSFIDCEALRATLTLKEGEFSYCEDVNHVQKVGFKK